jgi:hypothetical protein
MIGFLCFVVAVLASPTRHQLVVLRQLKGRARLTNDDRWFFVQLYRWFPSILPALMITRPDRSAARQTTRRGGERKT